MIRRGGAGGWVRPDDPEHDSQTGKYAYDNSRLRGVSVKALDREFRGHRDTM